MSNRYRSRRRRTRVLGARIRTGAFLVIVIAVLGLTGYLLRAAFFQPALAPMAGNVIDVQASMSGFDRTEIRIRAGEPVTIRLTSLDNEHHTDGGGQHQWAVDELGLDLIAQPLSSSYLTFTPDTAGVYTFYCDICCGGRANPTMSGTLIVES